MLLADDMSYPQQFNDSLHQCTIAVTKTTEIRNVFGFASYDYVVEAISDALGDVETAINAI